MVPPVIDLYPLLMDPVLVAKPWGGRRLERYGKRLPPGDLIGESWEVADLGPEVTGSAGGAQSLVANGTHAGFRLGDLLADLGPALLGEAAPAATGRFPLLVKLLDAREPLSVQVHPDEEYAAAQPGTFAKTESWYVVEAEPGAELYLGLLDGVGPADLRAACATGAVEAVVRRVPARRGDLHHLPAGTVHAVGPGVLVAEVQTPSDTTFRLYDWADRLGRAPRSMHVEQALAATRWDLVPPAPQRLPGDADAATLVDTPAYRVVARRGSAGLAPVSSFRIVMAVADRAVVHTAGGNAALSQGATAILPAGLGASVDATGTFLEVLPTR